MDKIDINIDEYRGVWIFAEQFDGCLCRASIELLSAASELADKLNVELAAILLGDDIKAMADELVEYGVHRVIAVEDPLLKDYRSEVYTKIITDRVKADKPEVFVFAATPIGRDLAPRLSFRLQTGCTADCTTLDVDLEKRLLTSIRPAFGGNVMATIICPNHRPQMSTVRPGVLQVPEKDPTLNGCIDIIDASLNPDDLMVDITNLAECRGTDDDIVDCDKLVCVGMGAGDKETFDSITKLAKVLDAGVAASRLAVEAGWISHDNQVGQTGKTVRPTLYFAFGISGAVQHTAGMSNSKFIVAVNSDPDAEIYKFADYGIVGDVKVIVPLLIQKIQTMKSA